MWLGPEFREDIRAVSGPIFDAILDMTPKPSEEAVAAMPSDDMPNVPEAVQTALHKRLQEGDVTAFHELWQLYGEQLSAMADTLMEQVVSAEGQDLLQSVYLEGMRMVKNRRFTYWNDHAFYGFMRVVLCRRAEDARRKVLPEVLDPYEAQRLGDVACRDVYFEAEQREEREECFSLIRAVVQSLSPLQHEIIVRKYWNLEKPIQTAWATGRRPGAVRTCLHRARNELAANRTMKQVYEQLRDQKLD